MILETVVWLTNFLFNEQILVEPRIGIKFAMELQIANHCESIPLKLMAIINGWIESIFNKDYETDWLIKLLNDLIECM